MSKVFLDARTFRRTQLPAPQPDMRAYKLNHWLALATSPKRFLNYRRFLRSCRGSTVDYLPVKLDFENVSRCNFHCTMCQVNGWPKHKRAEDMRLEDFKRLIDSQYGLVEIKLQGMGEPLLGGDVFFEMIRYARHKHIWVRTTTNGSILHLNDNYKKLIDSGINEVQISFDGATPQTFEKIRQGAKFDKIVENCKLINDYCNRRSLMRTQMWTVLQRENAHEFIDFVEMAAKLGFKRLTFALNLHGWGQQEWHALNEQVSVEDMITPELAAEAIEHGQELGVSLGFWNNTAKYDVSNREKLCPWPFERAYISSDLRVVPCCMIGNPNVADFGVAHDFTALWRGPAYQKFRQAHLDGNIPEICRICYMDQADQLAGRKSSKHA